MSPKKSAAPGSVQLAPHSWDFEHWPSHVWPHTAQRARYIVRTFKAELIVEGALSRVGREIVFNGLPYTRWLELHSAKAAKYALAMNLGRRPETDQQDALNDGVERGSRRGVSPA
jgi:hypothetical protein